MAICVWLHTWYIGFWSIIILFVAILLAIYYIHNISPPVLKIDYATLNTAEFPIPGSLALSSQIVIMVEFSTKPPQGFSRSWMTCTFRGKVIGRHAMVPPSVRNCM